MCPYYRKAINRNWNLNHQKIETVGWIFLIKYHKRGPWASRPQKKDSPEKFHFFKINLFFCHFTVLPTLENWNLHQSKDHFRNLSQDGSPYFKNKIDLKPLSPKWEPWKFNFATKKKLLLNHNSSYILWKNFNLLHRDFGEIFRRFQAFVPPCIHDT